MSSVICREDDTKWPQKNKDGRQELEIRLGSEHISFEVSPRRSALKCLETGANEASNDRPLRSDHWWM
jgi:protein mago nashi